MSFVYDKRVADALADHGLRPSPQTAPARTKEYVNDLYCYELRRLRAAFLAGQIPKREYAGHVVALRKKYWLLSYPIERWAEEEQ